MTPLPLMLAAMRERNLPVSRVEHDRRERRPRVVVFFDEAPTDHDKSLAEHLAQPMCVYHVYPGNKYHA